MHANQGNSTKSVLMMGHRGAKEVAPENTLAAFEFALKQGVDAIELDVHLSRDDELIVMHDADIARTTDGRGLVRALTLAELHEFDASVSATAGDYPRQQIPTLEEALTFIGTRALVNIEIKLDSERHAYPQIEAKVLDLLRRSDRLDTTILSSFDFVTLEKVQALEPKARIYAIVAQDYFRRMDAEEPDAIVAELQARRFDWVAINKQFINPRLTKCLGEAGIFVHTWVINEVDEMWHFVEMGVDAITTDRPDLLLPAYRLGASAARS